MSTLSGPRYRAGQLARALRPRISESERAAAGGMLGPRLDALFLSMSPADQRHCLDVYEHLLANGYRNSDLLIAALLHDAGKAPDGRTRVRLWHRVAFVLTGPLPPVQRLAARVSAGLRLLEKHADRGARLAESRGAPAEVVRLIRAVDEQAETDDRVRLLRAADDAC